MRDEAARKVEGVKRGYQLSRYLPQQVHVTESVVKCAGGEYQAFFKVGGVAFETAEPSKIDARHNLLISWLRQTLAGGEFGVTAYRVRRRLEAELEAEYDNDFSTILAEQYYERLNKLGALVTELYLVISFKPALDKVTKMLLKRGDAEAERRLEQGWVSQLEDACKSTESVLRQYAPERLGLYEQDGQVYSRIKDFLGFLVNGTWINTPLRRTPLSEQLVLAENVFRDEYRAISLHGKRRYAAYLDLQDYPDAYNTGALDALLYSRCEFVEVMSFRPANIVDGRERLKRMEGYLISAGDVTETELSDFATAQAAQKLGALVFGDFHYGLACFGESFEQAQAAKAEVQGIIAKSDGFRVGVVDVVPMCGMLSAIPGNWDYIPRQAFISDAAFFGLCPFHNFGGGKQRGNPWGEAVTVLMTPSRQPFYFNFHVTDENVDAFGKKVLGNCTIIGQSGSGKTVLETFLLSFLLKVKGIRMVLFDKDRGLEPFVRRIGGQYLALEIGKPTGLNPFHFDLTPAYRAHLVDLLKACIAEHGAVTLEEQILLEQAIVAVYNMPKPLRRLTTLIQNIPAAGAGKRLAEKLAKWTRGTDGDENGGSLAWVFDNDADTLEMNADRVIAFDYTEMLKVEQLVTVILLHLLYRMETLITGEPFVYVMAEFWRALQNKALAGFAGDKQKTIRKQNGLGIFDTQEPADMLKTAYGDTMVQQTAIKIFLPNGDGVWEDYKKMGCTEREFQLIKREFHAESRKFLIKMGDTSVVASLDLGGMDEALDILSGSTDNVELLQAVMEEHGPEPHQWVRPFHDAIAQRRGRFVDDGVFVDRGDGVPRLVR
jgi:type IV secretion system protein VirB4